MIANLIIRIVALFYMYGALVHIMNMLGLSGFDWLNAPLKWQVLDVVYLILDLLVAVGFFARWMVSYFIFYIAAVSQIVLYTVFKDWITDVPQAFTVSQEQESYLTTLVVFHIVTILLVSLAIRLKRVGRK